MSPRIDALLDEAHRLEVIVTDSVVEALALENHLIKQRSPKYNILLRDDKNYPYLQLTTGEAFPRVLVARRVERDDHFYAGPFLPASLARKTMSLTPQAVRDPLVQRGDHRRARPSVPRVRHQALRRAVRRASSAARTRVSRRGRAHAAVSRRAQRRTGHDPEGADDRGGRPTSASSRRRSCATRSGRSRRCGPGSRRWPAPELGDRDAFGLKLGPAGAVVQVFQVRGGRVVERIELVTELGLTTSRQRRERRTSEAVELEAAA